jgi:hypothetical protein
MSSTVHLVGGEKGGVGKSVVARLIAQNFIDRALPFVALDADGSHGALVRFYRDYARPIDLTRVESTDQIMELATETERRVLVDLPAQSERMLSKWIAEGGILDLARETEVKVVFWHVMDDGKDSVATLERLLDRHDKAAHYCIVKNLGRGNDFSLFDASAARSKADALGATVVELPELNASVMQKIDRHDASFWAAVHNPGFAGGSFSRMDRQRIRVWLESVFKAWGGLDSSVRGPLA